MARWLIIEFNISFSEVYPGSTGKWQDTADIAKYLNLGTLKNASDQTIARFRYIRGRLRGQITMALADGQFSEDVGKEGVLTAGTASVVGIKKSAALSSDIQILTREDVILQEQLFLAQKSHLSLRRKTGFPRPPYTELTI